METIALGEVRGRLREMVNAVKAGGAYIVTEYGTPAMEVVPPGTMARLEGLKNAPTE